VGGVKEKLLAAHAAGLTRALIPARNMREVELAARESSSGGAGGVGGASEFILPASGGDAGGTAGAADATSGGSSSSSGTGSGLRVIPVARLEDVLAAAFDPPYLLRRRAKL
jgi:predicted ATP-dependent protease